MKKLFFILIIIPFLSNAQDKKIDFGIRAGYINSWSSNIVINGMKHRNSFTGGLSINYNINKNISIESGLLLSNKGFSVDGSELTDQNGNPIGFQKIKYNISYIDIPLLLKPYFGKDIRYTIFAGFNTGFNNYAHYKYGIVDAKINNVSSVYESIVLGAGTKYKNISIESRIIFGFSNIYQNNSTHINSLYLLLGYNF